MDSKQFVDLYNDLNQGYIKHKQKQYKDYYHEQINPEPYTEELFWDELVPLGWRKDYTTTECLVLVCSVCEQAITKVVLNNIIDIKPLLKVEDKIQIHKAEYCKATAKQSKA
jgi:hypothetical protein